MELVGFLYLYSIHIKDKHNRLIVDLKEHNITVLTTANVCFSLSHLQPSCHYLCSCCLRGLNKFVTLVRLYE